MRQTLTIDEAFARAQALGLYPQRFPGGVRLVCPIHKYGLDGRQVEMLLGEDTGVTVTCSRCGSGPRFLGRFVTALRGS